MKVLVDLCIAECEKVLTAAGLKTSLHSYGTNNEGEWDDVFAAINNAMKKFVTIILPVSCRPL